MIDGDNEQTGPVMIAATRIINPPPARIGQLGPNFTLPRTVPVKSVIAGGIGLFPGVLLGALLGSAQGIIIGAIIGGAGGVGLVSIQPAKGENLLQWLTALARGRTRQRRVNVGGKQLALYIGVARITRVAGGKTRVVGGAIEVEPDSFDERGVLRSEANRNVEDRTPRTLRDERVDFRSVFDPSVAAELQDTRGREQSRRVETHVISSPTTQPAKPLRLGAGRGEPPEVLPALPAAPQTTAKPEVAPRSRPPRLGAHRQAEPALPDDPHM
jgi:hypothetical protein